LAELVKTKGDQRENDKINFSVLQKRMLGFEGVLYAESLWNALERDNSRKMQEG